MTQLERLKAVFDEMNVGFKIQPRTDAIEVLELDATVGDCCYFAFVFDSEGKCLEYGVYEAINSNSPSASSSS